MRQDDPHSSHDAGQTIALIVSWAIVGIPALWGVAQVVVKSLALFQ